MPKPAAALTPIDLNWPSKAAPRAATISKGVVVGSIRVIGAARIIAAPANIVASIQLTTPIRSAEIPTRTAPVSLSALALVDSPKLLKRYRAHTASDASTTMTVSQ